MTELGWEGYVTLAIIVGVFITLVRGWAPPDVVMLGASVLLGILRILTPEEAFAGFINPGVLTIAALFVVAAGVRETGALDTIGGWLLGKARTETGALWRLAGSVTPMSAFMNNTPVVAMLVPVLNQWCRRNNISPSRLLIPLSYLAILGGSCTLIGTSTNIVIDGLIAGERAVFQEALDEGELPPTAPDLEAAKVQRQALDPIRMFELSWVGIPFCVLGTVYLVFIGRKLLPDRQTLKERQGSSREYLIDMKISAECRMAGQNVEEAGLRHLPGLFLVGIQRGDKTITPVRPDQLLRVEDVLTFTGVVETIVDLERIPGFVPVGDENGEHGERERFMAEAVVSGGSPIAGKNIRDADFRARYNAAIIAVHRRGERLEGRVGDIVLQDGDTLLLSAGPHFMRAHRNDPDFYLVSGVEESRAARNDRQWLALVLVGVLVVLLSTGSLNPVFAASGIVVAMLVTQCISPAVARQSIDWQTLLTIGGAIGIGKALENTGTATAIAHLLVETVSVLGPYALLLVIYAMTGFLTEGVTTKGAAVLMFPIAFAAGAELGLNPRPFIMAVLYAAVASFVTPVGYQTNLMVWGPGGYRYTDYIKVGLPLSILLMLTATVLIPWVWPF